MLATANRKNGGILGSKYPCWLVAGGISWEITRGSSQSGTFIRQLIHYGFTQDEANRKVYDGAWPIVAARRIALNFRFAKPDLVMKLYEAGSEGLVKGDPRLSLEERYGTHANYVAVVKAAAARIVAQGFLLQADADALVAAAAASNVLNP